MANLNSVFSKGLTVLNLKTSNFFELNKIKTYITTLKSETALLKSEIGEAVYQDWVKGEIVIEHIQDKLTEIADKNAMIKRQKAEIEGLKWKEKQILGGWKDRRDAKEEPPAKHQRAVEMEAAVICPNCSQRYRIAVNYCKKCGTKLN